MRKSSLPKEAYQQFYGTYLSVLDDNELYDLLVIGKKEMKQIIEKFQLII